MQPDLVTTLPASLGETPLQLAIPPVVFYWGIGVLLGFFALTSIVLVYHWRQYGYEKVKMGIVTTTYFLGAGVLIALMILGTSAYLASI